MPRRRKGRRDSSIITVSESPRDQLNNSTLQREMVFNPNTILKIIPEFDGSENLLHKFLSSVDMIESFIPEDDKAIFLNLIKTRLNGNAYDVVKYQTIKNWEELKADLKSKFSTKRSYAQINADLVVSRQGNNTVLEFSSKIEKLLSELNNASIVSEGPAAAKYFTKINEKMALKAFEDGLDVNYRNLIKAFRFDNLKDAIKTAIEESQSQSHLNQNFSNLNISNSSNSNTTTQETCQICHKIGHTSIRCFYRYDNSNETGNFSRRPRNFSNQIHPNFSGQSLSTNQASFICNYCHFPGHIVANCRKRKFNEERKFQNPNSFQSHNQSAPMSLNNNQNSLQPHNQFAPSSLNNNQNSQTSYDSPVASTSLASQGNFQRLESNSQQTTAVRADQL